MGRRGQRPVRSGLALAALLSAAACATAQPGRPGTEPRAIEVSVEERFYPVAGLDARALNRALATQGPRRGARIAHALTEWRLAWSYVPSQGRSGCTSGRPSVAVEIVTTLPRWIDLPSASERLVNDWALFIARLRDHEARHQHLAMENSRELLSTLAALRAPSCDLLEEAAQHAATALRARYDAQHLDIDEATRYGLRETP